MTGPRLLLRLVGLFAALACGGEKFAWLPL